MAHICDLRLWVARFAWSRWAQFDQGLLIGAADHGNAEMYVFRSI
ncbi:hypothetical protein [Rhodococcus sp. OK302]|nr:hypothetical protein [Rhodococcus sp. OK302]